MINAFGRVSIVLGILVASVLCWAHWPHSVNDLLHPLNISESDFSLKRTRAELGKQPILLVVDLKDSHVYSRYIAEILKAEGLFCFETIDISSVPIDSALLGQYSIVITTDASQSLESYKSLLTNYVRLGGSLLMMAPPPAFCSLLGVNDTPRAITDGFVLFDSSSHLASGVSHIPLQFFGTARLYKPTNASVVARLSQDEDMEDSHVAMGLASYGKGRTGFIAYDLGKSIVFARQGRAPLGDTPHAIDKDGDGVFKTSDLFYDSYDYANRSVPQADEQQKIFMKLIFELVEGKMVLPRIWYFANESPAVALLTGDHHGFASQSSMRGIASFVDSANGHCSFFVYPGEIDPNIVRDLTGHGHALQPHLYYPATSNRLMRARLFVANWFSPTSFFRPGFSDLASEIDRGSTEFEELHVGKGRINRFHYLIWWGWSETPQLLAQKGYRMDLSISGIDPHHGAVPNPENNWNSPTGYGYVNGSGQPMRVISPEGKLIDLFSQLTQFEDDVVAREFIASPPNDSVTTHSLIEVSKRFIDESINYYHTVLVWNFHPEHTVQRWPAEAPTTGPWFRATVKYLKERSIPMLSVVEWLGFVQARRSIFFNQVVYNPTAHSGTFHIACSVDLSGVSVMLPVEGKGIPAVEIFAGGSRVHPPSSIKTLNGISYLVFQSNLAANQPVQVSYSFH